MIISLSNHAWAVATSLFGVGGALRSYVDGLLDTDGESRPVSVCFPSLGVSGDLPLVLDLVAYLRVDGEEPTKVGGDVT